MGRRMRLSSLRDAIGRRLRPLAAPAQDRAHEELRALVRRCAGAELAPRTELLRESRAEAEAARDALERLERSVPKVAARLWTGPFRAETTVHAAWQRHPGVAAVFARRGLPRCLDCAVGEDETLAEAATGEGFGVEGLLAELNGLIRGAEGAPDGGS